MNGRTWSGASGVQTIPPSLATAAVACAVLVAFAPKGVMGRTPEEEQLYKWALRTTGHYVFDTPNWCQ